MQKPTSQSISSCSGNELPLFRVDASLVIHSLFFLCFSVLFPHFPNSVSLYLILNELLEPKSLYSGQTLGKFKFLADYNTKYLIHELVALRKANSKLSQNHHDLGLLHEYLSQIFLYRF
jgi:hypothetical protein